MDLIERLRDWASARYEVQLTEVSDMQSACAEAADEIERLTKERDALRKELLNIANAKRFDRNVFETDTEFADWAQSRCRYFGRGDAAADAAMKEKP